MLGLLGCLLAGASGCLAADAAETVDQQTKAALSLDADPKRGARVFQANCSRCHGSRAEGNAARLIPSLAGQRFSYLVRQLADLHGGERDSETMHRVLAAPELGEPQTWVDVASYLNAQKRSTPAQTGSGRDLGLGEWIYRVQCASCHHEDARGDDEGYVPALRQQHYAYLVSQLSRMSRYSRHNLDEDLVQFLGSLEADEVSGVADYLSRMKGPVGDRSRMRPNGVVVD